MKGNSAVAVVGGKKKLFWHRLCEFSLANMRITRIMISQYMGLSTNIWQNPDTRIIIGEYMGLSTNYHELSHLICQLSPPVEMRSVVGYARYKHLKWVLKCDMSSNTRGITTWNLFCEPIRWWISRSLRWYAIVFNGYATVYARSLPFIRRYLIDMRVTSVEYAAISLVMRAITTDMRIMIRDLSVNRELS